MSVFAALEELESKHKHKIVQIKTVFLKMSRFATVVAVASLLLLVGITGMAVLAMTRFARATSALGIQSCLAGPLRLRHLLHW